MKLLERVECLLTTIFITFTVDIFLLCFNFIGCFLSGFSVFASFSSATSVSSLILDAVVFPPSGAPSLFAC